MPLTRVMLIRHAERPTPGVGGVALDGTPDLESLTARGWQRAGALVRFFAPLVAAQNDSPILSPNVIFAAGIGPGSKSQRAVQTASPLAELLGTGRVPFKTNHLKDDYQAMANEVLAQNGAVLIVWEHTLIAAIVSTLTSGTVMPAAWPGDRFDMVWSLEQNAGAWKLTRVPQLLLPGDQA